jgi:hypothetical protein
MGIESLSPMQPAMQPAMQSAMYNPLENNPYGGTPMMMAGGGSAKLVEREQYGLGSVLKKFAKTFIPKELDPILQVAAPFLGPVYGPIASIAGSARTGKINPYSLAASTLPYVKFGGEGATGLGSFMPTGYGGSGALGQFLPGGDLQIGSGTNLASKLSEFMKVGTPSSTGNVSFEMGPDGLKLPGTTISDALSNKPMGTGDLFKTIFSPEASVDLGTRAKAAMDLTGSAIKAMYTNQDGSVDKRAVIATISAVPSYLDAKKKAQEAGLTDNDFNEQIYNEQKQAYASRYASNAPASSFGIRTTAAGGGMMDDESGLLSIKLTPREGYLLGDLVAGSGVAIPRPGQYEVSSGGGLGGMMAKLIQQNPQMFRPQGTSSSTSSMADFIDVDPKDGIDDRTQRANGGRMDYAMGSEIPVRQNQGGVSELDLRAKGGYIPVGIKEKADDVPAMLSKNEFVFTADAVRGAGNGSINKGAQKMYKLMKSLEKKVKKTKVA